VVEGEVKNATEFGLFIGLDGDVDGMVHMSDIAWGISGEDALALHRKGETVKAIVLDVDTEKERISLGIKQLEKGAPRRQLAGGQAAAAASTSVARSSPSPCSKSAMAGSKFRLAKMVRPASSSVPTLAATATSSVRTASRLARSSTRMVTGFDRSKKPNFSIKALQLAEEKQAVAQYGSSDSGASLGDILGEALKAGVCWLVTSCPGFMGETGL
jgi:small subunit ribosomal protein S1